MAKLGKLKHVLSCIKIPNKKHSFKYLTLSGQTEQKMELNSNSRCLFSK